MKGRRRIAAALLAGTAAALLLGEGLLRLGAWADRRFLWEARTAAWASSVFTDPSAFAGLRRFQPSRSYGNTPNISLPSIHINSEGFRGPEIRTPKPPGVLRVACLGDSCTFGWNLKDEETYPVRLQALLSEASPTPVDVINAGSPGYASWQALDWCRESVFALDPDVLVVYLGWNDLFEARPEGTVGRAEKSLVYLLSKSLLLTKLRWAAVSLRRRISRADPAAEAALFRNHDPLFFRQQMRALLREAKGRGLRVILLTLPTLHREDGPPAGGPDRDNPAKFEALYAAYNAALRRSAEEEGADLLDLRPDMNGRPDFFRDLCHPSVEGNELIARKLSERILAGGTRP